MNQVLVAIAAALLGWGLTGLALAFVRRREHLAMPTERGLHAAPTPVGGGLGLIGATLALWMILHWPLPSSGTLVALGVVVLGVISWLDDRQPLPPIVRLTAQALVVFITLWSLPAAARIVPAWPLGLERAALAFGWLWMTNLTNFMDGVDGLAGTEAATVGLGYAIVTHMAPSPAAIPSQLPDLALILTFAALGYLVWNWAPARIFMGDVGSIPLGFLLGLFMLDLAYRGLWAAALILPLYFIADATTTLLDRLGRGAKPWQAHREHAYQRAVLSGLSHAVVVLHIAVLNAALVALAVLSISAPWNALAAAGGLTAALLAWFRTRAVTPAKAS